MHLIAYRAYSVTVATSVAHSVLVYRTLFLVVARIPCTTTPWIRAGARKFYGCLIVERYIYSDGNSVLVVSCGTDFGSKFSIYGKCMLR